ncbi:hypothetical protein HPB47_003194 [Ixodes persulcatus]|uniref:Uncharacterized protein n=1 Tax=Ixodes persulcatus TaxID=34615 RepID=A0AC60PK66_IXOPE|nr:hypothetical protein HPB47_003194 [Ixodes persulcatus]
MAHTALVVRNCKRTWDILRALLNREGPTATLLEQIQKFILYFPDNSEGIPGAVKTEFFGEPPLQGMTIYPNYEGEDNTELEKSFTRVEMEAGLGRLTLALKAYRSVRMIFEGINHAIYADDLKVWTTADVAGNERNSSQEAVYRTDAYLRDCSLAFASEKSELSILKKQTSEKLHGTSQM